MAVERIDNGFLEIGTRYRLLCQTLKQNLSLVQEAGGAIAALESKMVDESFLQNRKFGVLRMAFDRADSFAVEARRRNNAGRAGVARPVGIIDNHRASQALRSAAAELGAGQPEVLAQKIIHGQIVAHFHRAVCATIDRDAQCIHVSTPLSMCWVTGKDWNR